MKKLAAALLSVFTICSCAPDDPCLSVVNDRTLQYEITGDFTGNNIIIAYTSANGATVKENITSLPWTKTLTVDAGVTSASIVISASNGTAEQYATLVIKGRCSFAPVGISATADAAGSLTIASPVITL